MPVTPATQEPKAGESLKPRRDRLQWAKIGLLDSSLGDKSETLFQKKEKLFFLLKNHTSGWNPLNLLDRALVIQYHGLKKKKIFKAE